MDFDRKQSKSGWATSKDEGGANVGNSSECYVSVAQLKSECGSHSESGCWLRTKVTKGEGEMMWKAFFSSSLLPHISYSLVHWRKREVCDFSNFCGRVVGGRSGEESQRGARPLARVLPSG